MFSNRSNLSLVRNVVSGQKRSRYQLEFFQSLNVCNNCTANNLKFEYNLKLKLFLIRRMTKLFNPGLQLRGYFSVILNYCKTPSVINVENCRLSSKVVKSNSQCSNGDMDFISEYSYEKSLIDYSIILLKENFISKSQWLIKLMKCEGEMNKTAVENVLENFQFLRKKIMYWDEKEKEEVRMSNEVAEFLKSLKLNLSQISPKNLIYTLSFFGTFNLPLDHDVVILTILRLIDEVKSLTFSERVYLHQLLRFFSETELVQELKLELKHKIENHVLEELENFSSGEILQALKYASANTVNWHDNDLILLYDAALKTDENIWKNRFGFTSCYKLVNKLNNADTEIYKEKLFKKLYEYMLQTSHNKTSNLCEFALMYAFNVRLQKESYDAEFFNHIINSILKNKVSLHEWQTLLFSMNILGHIRFDVIEKMKNLFMERPLLAYKSFYLFKNIIVLIIDSNCVNKRQPWPHFHLYLEDLLSLKDMSFWTKEDLNLSLRVVVALASVGIFSDDVLDFLAQKSSEVKEDQRICIPYLYIAINQAVTILYPSYTKQILTKEKLSCATSRLKFFGTPDYLVSFTTSVEKMLESVLPNKNCFIMNHKTKLGHSINFITAVNAEGKYFNFSSVIEEKEKIYVEDIVLPRGYKLLLFLIFSECHYTRNFFSLRSVARIRVKTLEKMGFNVAYILYGKWMNLTHEQQKRFITLKLNKTIYWSSKSSLGKT